MAELNLDKLKEHFPPSDISWRIGQAGKSANGPWAKVLAYIDNRNIMDRLDEVCGPANWRNEYTRGPEGGVLCGLSIRIEGEWVTKWDGAENSDIESVKGGLSDSMKRAAVHWGIGRYLYDLGETWAQVVEKGTQGSHYANCKIKGPNSTEEWVTFYWLPPRDALPKPAPQFSGVTTADKLLTKTDGEPTAYDLAIKTIAEAREKKDKKLLKKIEERVMQRHREGKISEGDYLDLGSKLADAEEAIENALLKA